jgi:hypothetical protein
VVGVAEAILGGDFVQDIMLELRGCEVQVVKLWS